MIQRIQSIYLIISVVFSAVSCFFLDIWKKAGEWLQVEDNISLLITNLAVVLLLATSIFLFKNRKKQLQIVYLSLITNVVFIGLLLYNLWNLPGGFNSEKGIGLLSPFVILLLLLLAQNGIKKDEKLVKSVDRIR